MASTSRSLGSKVVILSARSVILSVANGYPPSRVLHVLLLLLTLFAVAPASAQSTKADEQALFKLEDDFTKAVVKRDPVALGRIVAPRWVYSDESGVMERDAAIKVFTSGPDTVRSATNEGMRALVYGNSAVVIGVLVLKGRGPKGAFTSRYRYTDAWAKIDGQWRCIASQDYLMPSAKH